MKPLVITGAPLGLKPAAAIGFAADGWTVSGYGTDKAALQSPGAKLGPDHHVEACDVTDPAAAASEPCGTPKLLLNNAGGVCQGGSALSRITGHPSQRNGNHGSGDVTHTTIHHRDHSPRFRQNPDEGKSEWASSQKQFTHIHYQL